MPTGAGSDHTEVVMRVTGKSCGPCSTRGSGVLSHTETCLQIINQLC